jgi:hypothetical protein
MDGKMKKKIFMTFVMGACAFGLFMGGAMPLTELPYEIVTR